MAAMTSKRRTLKWRSNQTPKLTSVNSKITNHIPLVNKNFLVAEKSLFLWYERNEAAPDRKTKVGAHKCVIHLVRKRAGVVVCKFVGKSVTEVW